MDTNILIWAVIGSTKLSRDAKRLIDRADTVHVSSASIWEISMKEALGKLKIDIEYMFEDLESMNVDRLPITWEHGRAAGQLPLHHRDPFDRILIAQALSESLTLLTTDELLSAYGDFVRVV